MRSGRYTHETAAPSKRPGASCLSTGGWLSASRQRAEAPKRRMSQVIALVDDDRNILTSVSIALQQEGFVTRIYSDGASALKAFAENPPDLGVFDIKMPG